MLYIYLYYINKTWTIILRSSHLYLFTLLKQLQMDKQENNDANRVQFCGKLACHCPAQFSSHSNCLSTVKSIILLVLIWGINGIFNIYLFFEKWWDNKGNGNVLRWILVLLKEILTLKTIPCSDCLFTINLYCDWCLVSLRIESLNFNLTAGSINK